MRKGKGHKHLYTGRLNLPYFLFNTTFPFSILASDALIIKIDLIFGSLLHLIGEGVMFRQLITHIQFCPLK
jgi:hypothetical protein